ncbi:MAG: hypothetical protein L0221_10710 [Chloroflexi bacterium]|nr:hypothetical protein [Chloroflexota bacterium]
MSPGPGADPDAPEALAPEPLAPKRLAPEPLTPEAQVGWRASGRDVAVVAVLAVAIVLGAAALTGFLPDELQRIVFHTPLAIGVLVIGTGWVLYRIARPGR